MTKPQNCRYCTIRHTPKCTDPNRWPVQPLIELIEHRTDPLVLFTVSHAELHRVMQDGMSTFQADRWCIRAGYHPAQVYGPSWFEAGLSVVDRQFLDSGWRQGWLYSEDQTNEQQEEAA